MKKYVVKIVAGLLIAASVGLNAWLGLATVIQKWKLRIAEETISGMVGQINQAIERDGKVVFTFPDKTLILVPYVGDQKPR